MKPLGSLRIIVNKLKIPSVKGNCMQKDMYKSPKNLPPASNVTGMELSTFSQGHEKSNLSSVGEENIPMRENQPSTCSAAETTVSSPWSSSLADPKSPSSTAGGVEYIRSVEVDPLTETPSIIQKSGTVRSAEVYELPMELKQSHLKRRRKIQAAGAPKLPLTGYVRYMNARREQLRLEFPEKTGMEHKRIIGEEWTTMPKEKKIPYLKEAEVDRQRYTKELNDFFKFHPDILASELAKDTIFKDNENRTAKSVFTRKTQVNAKTVSGNSSVEISASPNLNNTTNMAPKNNSKTLQTTQATQTNIKVNSCHSQLDAGLHDNGGIPVFTEEFLEHNKCVDMELRTLRKSSIHSEEQNALLEKHVEKMKFGVENMVTENDELQVKNRLLETYLDKLKLKLAQALSGLPIPTEPNGATLDNIDKYMSDLSRMVASNRQELESLNKAKDIIRKLDLMVQL